MIINLSPIGSTETLSVSVVGDILILNGVELDFTPMTEGATLPNQAIDCKWVLGGVYRTDGEINVTIQLPNTEDASELARFPSPIHITVDGPVELPK